MMLVETLSPWLAWLTSFLVVTGAFITLVGSFGLARLKSFYERVHAPTLGATLGAGFILVAAIIYFSVLSAWPVLMTILIAVFITLTTPVALILLARAALYRDRSEGKKDVPEDC